MVLYVCQLVPSWAVGALGTVGESSGNPSAENYHDSRVALEKD